MSAYFQLFHEAEDEVDIPQVCKRCGRELVSGLRMPFVPGQLVLDYWDMEIAPPQLIDRKPIDTAEKPSSSPWCTEVVGLPD